MKIIFTGVKDIEFDNFIKHDWIKDNLFPLKLFFLIVNFSYSIIYITQNNKHLSLLPGFAS